VKIIARTPNPVLSSQDESALAQWRLKSALALNWVWARVWVSVHGSSTVAVCCKRCYVTCECYYSNVTCTI